jgi:ubiquinone biosynthesis protein
MLQTKLGRNTVNAVRLGEVLQVFVRYGFIDIIQRIGLSDGLPARVLRGLKIIDVPKGEPATIGARLCGAFTELGPTFIKFGQVLSTRPDILGEKLAKDLAVLQDRVEPMAFHEIRVVIEEQLGGPIEELFAEFNRTSVASASLSQVYRAKLHTGEDVAVKVRRPGVDRRIESDLSLMMQIAEWVAEHLEDAQMIDPPGVVEEFSRSIRRELDFNIEARVIDQFRTNFEGDEFVLVPRVYHQHSAVHVLTMEWVDGVRVDRLDAYEERNSDPATVAAQGCEALCKMIFEHHLFHADPHPGNLFLTRDNQLAFLDLGMAGHLERSDTAAIADLLLAIFHQDAAECVEAILALASEGDVDDREHLEHEIAEFIAFEAQTIIANGELSKGLDRAVQIVHRHRLRLAPRFSLLLKGLATIEIVGRQLDPELDLIPILEPYIRKLITDRYQPSNLMRDAQQNASLLLKLTRQAPYDAGHLLQQLRKGKFQMRVRHEQLTEVTAMLDRTSNRNALATIVASMVVGSGIVITADSTLRPLGAIGFIAAAILAVWLAAGILWSRKY